MPVYNIIINIFFLFEVIYTISLIQIILHCAKRDRKQEEETQI